MEVFLFTFPIPEHLYDINNFAMFLSVINHRQTDNSMPNNLAAIFYLK
jgi:hypothetical protein